MLIQNFKHIKENRKPQIVPNVAHRGIIIPEACCKIINLGKKEVGLDLYLKLCTKINFYMKLKESKKKGRSRNKLFKKYEGIDVL